MDSYRCQHHCAVDIGVISVQAKYNRDVGLFEGTTGKGVKTVILPTPTGENAAGTQRRKLRALSSRRGLEKRGTVLECARYSDKKRAAWVWDAEAAFSEVEKGDRKGFGCPDDVKMPPKTDRNS